MADIWITSVAIRQQGGRGAPHYLEAALGPVATGADAEKIGALFGEQVTAKLKRMLGLPTEETTPRNPDTPGLPPRIQPPAPKEAASDPRSPAF